MIITNLVAAPMLCAVAYGVTSADVDLPLTLLMFSAGMGSQA